MSTPHGYKARMSKCCSVDLTIDFMSLLYYIVISLYNIVVLLKQKYDLLYITSVIFYIFT